MALVLVIVSFSCVGPLVATNLFEAAQGKSYLGPTVGMLSFSSALAIPFMVFAAFPGLMNNLPKSGGWLNSVKVVLGFIELALCLVYFSRADLVLQTGWLDREIFLGAWIVIFFLLGVYLLGKLQLPHDSPVDRISVPACYWRSAVSGLPSTSYLACGEPPCTCSVVTFLPMAKTSASEW
jgi:thiol:disulfide interchange protein